MAEIHALGLVNVVRYQKRYLISISDGWRTVTKRDAAALSASARARRMPVPPPPQPAWVSAR